MRSKVTFDRVGRIVLHGATALEKERGVWVFRAAKRLTAGETEKTLRNIRAQRHGQVAGKSQ